MFKKILLIMLVAAMSLAMIPLTTVYAASEGSTDEVAQVDQPRLERVWYRQLRAYHQAVARLDTMDILISKVQTLIDKVTAKELDASAVQAALDHFATAVKDARPIINSMHGLVTSHQGFDENGKVIDQGKAVETVTSMSQHLKEARSAMNGTARALRAAIREFRLANPPVKATN